MPLTTTVTLYDGVTTVTLPSPPPEIDAPANVPGVVHRTQGGSLVHYKVGPIFYETTFHFDGLTDAQASSLESFFETNWGNSVTYTDAQGNAYTAYFLDQSLPLHKVYKGLWQVQLHLQLSAILK